MAYVCLLHGILTYKQVLSSYGHVPLMLGQYLHHSALYSILRQPNHCCSRLCSV